MSAAFGRRPAKDKDKDKDKDKIFLVEKIFFGRKKKKWSKK